MNQQASYQHVGFGEARPEEFGRIAAEYYERHFVPAIAAPVAADLLRAADLRPGERVLDVACGTGLIARLAAERVGPTGTVVGVDVAPGMLEVARSVTVPSGPAIEWREGDAASLPVPDASFDIVCCQMGLMLVPDKAAALSEMRRALVPGGRLVLNTPGTINQPMEILAEGLARHINPDLAGFVHAVFSMDDPAEHERLLTDAGFGDVDARVVTATVRLPPPREFLWQYVNATPMGPIVSQAPEAARAALEEDVVGQWEAFVEDGAGAFDQPVVLATGRA